MHPSFIILSHKSSIHWVPTSPVACVISATSPDNPGALCLFIFFSTAVASEITVLRRLRSSEIAVLRQLCSIRPSVPATTFQTLIVSLVLSRLDYGNAVLAGFPAYLFRQLQLVMNAAAWLIYGLRHSDHISDALIALHWLQAHERVRFKTAMLMYKATHGTALSYLSQLVCVTDLPGRRSLRSALTVGGRAFPVAGPTILNSLPDNVISALSLSTFRQRLKTFLFQASFPDIITDPGKLFPTSSGS